MQKSFAVDLNIKTVKWQWQGRCVYFFTLGNDDSRNARNISIFQSTNRCIVTTIVLHMQLSQGIHCQFASV